MTSFIYCIASLIHVILTDFGRIETRKSGHPSDDRQAPVQPEKPTETRFANVNNKLYIYIYISIFITSQWAADIINTITGRERKYGTKK